MYTEGHIIYGCIQQQQQLYLAANTDFSPILEMGGLGGSWSEDWRSFVSRAAEEGRHKVGGEGRVAESPARTHTNAHKVRAQCVCMVAKLATYTEWPVPDRSITPMRASLHWSALFYRAGHRLASCERAISRTRPSPGLAQRRLFIG